MASASAPANKIERAHQMYREGSYREALGFYTEALGMAKTKPQKIALHSNRAACYLKLHDFKKAAEECTSVLELDQKHTGALMLRAQTLVTLKEYHSALFDVNRLMELNPSSDVYQNLYDRLKTQLSLAPIPEAEGELEEEDEDRDDREPKRHEVEVQEEIKAEKRKEEEKDVIDTTAGRSVMFECEKTIPDTAVRRNEKSGFERTIPDTAAGRNEKPESEKSIPNAPQTTLSSRESSEKNSQGWQAIPKPKGHSHLDYSRWDRVEDDSSEEDDDDEDQESQPQYRFRVRTIGVRPVK